MNKDIVQIIHGSKLYGVSNENSDTDIKSVFVVDNIHDLYEGVSSVIETSNGKTGADKIEMTSFYSRKFAQMLYQGQTVAFEMLFAPRSYWIASSNANWNVLYERRKTFVSKNVTPFVAYARSQASKYSLKGNKLKTLYKFVEDITLLHDNAKDVNWFEFLAESYKDSPGVRLWEDEKGGVKVPMIEICGKSFGKTTDLKLWIPPLEKLIKTFGERSEAAMLSEGKDLKAMYHAVRIVDQCIELLENQTITFPRPNADFLKSIRSGSVELEEVSDIIDSRTIKMNKLLSISTLPETCDADYLESWAWLCQKGWLT